MFKNRCEMAGPTAISQIFKLAKNRCEMAVVCEMAVDPSGKLRNGSGSGICEMAGDREFKPQFIEGV